MVCELANYDTSKYEWVSRNNTVIDFKIRSSYKKYNAYNEWLSYKNKGEANNNNNNLE